jgi:hypothetical protein
MEEVLEEVYEDSDIQSLSKTVMLHLNHEARLVIWSVHDLSESSRDNKALSMRTFFLVETSSKNNLHMYFPLFRSFQRFC